MLGARCHADPDGRPRILAAGLILPLLLACGLALSACDDDGDGSADSDGGGLLPTAGPVTGNPSPPANNDAPQPAGNPQPPDQGNQRPTHGPPNPVEHGGEPPRPNPDQPQNNDPAARNDAPTPPANPPMAGGDPPGQGLPMPPAKPQPKLAPPTPAGPFTGSFAGTLQGAPITCKLTQTGNRFNGRFTGGGETSTLNAQVQGNTAQGVYQDDDGSRGQFTATINGDALSVVVYGYNEFGQLVASAPVTLTRVGQAGDRQPPDVPEEGGEDDDM